MRRILFLTFIFCAVTANAATVHRKEVLSDIYTIDKRYRSMEGPGTLQTVFLAEAGAPELLWITGVRTEMVGEDGTTPQLPELMCHVNVDLDPARHKAFFDFKRPVATRLVTLSQGVVSVRVPEGFGFPVISNEPLVLFTQVLNHNIANPKNLKVRHRVTFEYLRDSELDAPIKPLFNVGASGMVLLNDNPLAIPAAVDLGGPHGQTCLMAPRAPNAAGTASDYIDPTGRKLTGHWVVPPGKQVNHTDITWFMDLPYDVTLHYAAVHLHPFARSLTLRDLTTDQTIFVAKAVNPKKGVGLEHVDSFTSIEGVQLHKDHKYELVSVYNNTSRAVHDSMASIFLGIADPEFVRPDAKTLADRVENAVLDAMSDDVMLETSVGEVGITLMKNETPALSRWMKKLIRDGALNGAKLTSVSQSALTFTVPLAAARSKEAPVVEGTFANAIPGLVARCQSPSADQLTFSIILDSTPKAEWGCVPFAKVGPGVETIRRISTAGNPAVITLNRASIAAAAPPSMALSKPSM